jgi:hypothetical protein
MKKFTLPLSLVLVGVLSNFCFADLQILNFDPTRNDRFNGSSNFIANGFDLSSVGKDVTTANDYVNNSDGQRWATLISPSFALSANHFTPQVGDSLTFMGGNSAGSPSVTDTVSHLFNIDGPNSDLELIQLTNPINNPNIHFAPIVADNPAALNGILMYVYGQSNRVGQNNIDPGSFQMFTNVQGSNPGFGYTYTYNPNSSNPNEAMLQAGDSGGPSFVVSNGQFALVGTHWFNFTGTDANGNPIMGSGDTYDPHYIADINTAIAGTGSTEHVTVVGVPEPASLILIGIGGPSLFAILRRRKSAASIAA